MRARAASATASRPASSGSRNASSTAAASSARMISRLGRRIVSMPSQMSEMTGVPQAAASNSRTLGLWPARTMSARVTLSV
jgi:hypothetical protein